MVMHFDDSSCDLVHVEILSTVGTLRLSSLRFAGCILDRTGRLEIRGECSERWKHKRRF